MENRNVPSDIRRIKLTRSEPLVFPRESNAIIAASVKRVPQSALLKKKNDLQARTKREDKNPTSSSRQSVRPKITVVSPKRKIRLPTTSSSEFSRRSNADGASSPYFIDEEKGLSAFKFRYPGDGCNSESNFSDDNSTDDDNDNDDDGTIDDDYCGTHGTDAALFEEEELYDDRAFEGDFETVKIYFLL